MSFHGGLVGIIIGTYFFQLKEITYFILFRYNICVAPIGIFLGRIANFINGELVGKTTDVFWELFFPI